METEPRARIHQPDPRVPAWGRTSRWSTTDPIYVTGRNAGQKTLICTVPGLLSPDPATAQNGG